MIPGGKLPGFDADVNKKQPDQKLTDEDENECFFPEHNVFKFKVYRDGIRNTDVCKIEWYGLFCMTMDTKVNEIPLEAVTITVLQHSFPRDVLYEFEAKS